MAILAPCSLLLAPCTGATEKLMASLEEAGRLLKGYMKAIMHSGS
jgi:hypothetical protein